MQLRRDHSVIVRGAEAPPYTRLRFREMERGKARRKRGREMRATVVHFSRIGKEEATCFTQTRGVIKTAPLPPYRCNAEAGVCLCVGTTNSEQMTQPTPCKRPKFCSGQTASPPPPVPPQTVPQSRARTIGGKPGDLFLPIGTLRSIREGRKDLGITGTPRFLIGNTLVAGVTDSRIEKESS